MKKLNKNAHESPYVGRAAWGKAQFATNTISDTYRDGRRRACS